MGIDDGQGGLVWGYLWGCRVGQDGATNTHTRNTKTAFGGASPSASDEVVWAEHTLGFVF